MSLLGTILYLISLAITLLFTAVSVPAAAVTSEITLSEALSLALTQNPHISASRYQYNASRARVRESTSQLLPRLTAGGSYTRYDEPNIIVPIHQAGVFPPLDDQIQEANVRLQLPLLDGGRRWAERRAARAEQEESLAITSLTEIEVLWRVSEVFLTVAELRDYDRSINLQLKALEQRRYEMARLLSEGRVSPVDTALLRTSLESLRADSLMAASRSWDAAIRLGSMLGMDEPRLPSISSIGIDSGRRPGSPAQQMDLAPSKSTLSGPSVDAAMARLERAEALRTVTARSFWPEISGFFVYSYRSGADWDFTGEWMAGATLTLPLFDGGARYARKRAATASSEAARQLVKAAIDEQRAAEMEAFQHLQTAQDRQQRLDAAVAAKTQAVDARRLLFENGDLDLSALLIDEAELLRLQIDRNGAAYDALSAILGYHAVVGTLDSETAIRLLEAKS